MCSKFLLTFLLLVNLVCLALTIEAARPPPAAPPEMLLIPAGNFLSGPVRTPTYLADFYVDVHEVTNAEFAAYVRASGYSPRGNWQAYATPGRERYPVVGVTWADANAYALFNDKRLMTTLEWEKACRGNDGRLWPWGHHWVAGASNVNTRSAAAVKSFAADKSPYGVFDMAGNVMEWTQNPIPVGTSRAVTGSCWLYLPREAFQVTGLPATVSSHVVGFRCAWPR